MSKQIQTVLVRRPRARQSAPPLEQRRRGRHARVAGCLLVSAALSAGLLYASSIGSAETVRIGVDRDNLPFGLPIDPEKPDTVEAYYSVSTSAGSCAVQLGGAAFVPTDVGKLIRIPGAGSNEGYFNGRIARVSDATHISAASPCPTRSMSDIPQRVTFGSDQTRNLQTAATRGAKANVGMFVQAGTYLTTAPIVCLPAPLKNSQNAPGALCNMDMGATIMAMAPMTSVVQTGSLDFSAPIRNGTWGGGTVDCNFLAKYGDDVPLLIVGTLKDRVAKNCLLAGVREGREPTDANPAAGTGGGMLLSNWNYNRDTLYVPIVGLTNANPAVVTTKFDHGLTTGRTVTLIGMATAGHAELEKGFFEVEVVDARRFKLRNVDTTADGPFRGSALMAMNMPSMHVPHFVTAISKTNPAVVTLRDAHNYADGKQVWLADMQGISLGGVYTACGVGPRTFTLHIGRDARCTGQTVDGRSIGTYTGNGSVEAWDDPLTVEKGVYLANMPDADGMNLQIKGVRWGIYANPRTSGFDGKWDRFHIYNFGEDGQLFSGTSLGADEVIESGQIDVPFRYGYLFTGPRNTVVASRVNYAGNQQYNNYASAFRLNPGAQADVFGGGAKADNKASMLGVVSCNGCSYGHTPGFTSLGFEPIYVSITQPDTTPKGDFRIVNAAGGASVTLRGSTAASVLSLCGGPSGSVGTSLTMSAGQSYLNTVDQSCTYTGTSLRLTPGGANADGFMKIAKLAGGGNAPTVTAVQPSTPAPMISRGATDTNGTVTAGEKGQTVTVAFANGGYKNPRDCNVTWLGGTAGIVGVPSNSRFELTFSGSALKATYQCMGL